MVTVMVPITTMAALAARTSRLKFGPSVLTIPFRTPSWIVIRSPPVTGTSVVNHPVELPPGNYTIHVRGDDGQVAPDVLLGEGAERPEERDALRIIDAFGEEARSVMVAVARTRDDITRGTRFIGKCCAGERQRQAVDVLHQRRVVRGQIEIPGGKAACAGRHEDRLVERRGSRTHGGYDRRSADREDACENDPRRGMAFSRCVVTLRGSAGWTPHHGAPALE